MKFENSKIKTNTFKIILISIIIITGLIIATLLIIRSLKINTNDEHILNSYKDALINLANIEYKDKNKLENSNNYIGYISSINYENSSNELTYASCTNLDNDNYLVVIQIKTPTASNLKESLNFLDRNYKDRSFEYTVEFYEKFVDSNKETDSFINSFTNSSNSKIANIGKTLNPNLYVMSFTYIEDDKNLKSYYGDYDASLNEFSLNSCLYQEILETDKDIYSIFNF